MRLNQPFPFLGHLCFFPNGFTSGDAVKTWGPQPPDRGPLPVRGLFGTGPHSGRRVAGEQRSLLYLLLLPSTGVPASAPPQVVRPWVLRGAPVPGATKDGDRWGRAPAGSRQFSLQDGALRVGDPE